MAAKKSAQVQEVQEALQQSSPMTELALALRDAIEATRPAEKKNIFTRKANTPWTPKDGKPKLKLKRKIYQHSLPIFENRLTNEQIELLNRMRPGVYMDGHVRVIRRRDKGLDIDYPIKSIQQRLKLSSVFGVTSFTDLVRKINEEADKPRKSEFDLSDED